MGQGFWGRTLLVVTVCLFCGALLLGGLAARVYFSTTAAVATVGSVETTVSESPNVITEFDLPNPSAVRKSYTHRVEVKIEGLREAQDVGVLYVLWGAPPRVGSRIDVRYRVRDAHVEVYEDNLATLLVPALLTFLLALCCGILLTARAE